MAKLSKAGIMLNRKWLLICVAALGCSSPTLPDDTPTIVGEIYARNIQTPTSGNRPTMHIKSSPSDLCGIIFAIGDESVLRRRIGTHTVSARLEDFTVGKSVRAWSEGGLVMESCPAQAFAIAVELLD